METMFLNRSESLAAVGGIYAFEVITVKSKKKLGTNQ